MYMNDDTIRTLKNAIITWNRSGLEAFSPLLTFTEGIDLNYE